MTKGRQHENYGALIGHLVNEITVELGIPFSSNRETTWKRPEVSRGLEADQSYYFRPEKLAAAAQAKARGSNDVADYPNPDLTIEIDISPSLIDRPAIYAALGVTEVWRFDGELLTIERLNPHGSYSPTESMPGSRSALTKSSAGLHRKTPQTNLPGSAASAPGSALKNDEANRRDTSRLTRRGRREIRGSTRSRCPGWRPGGAGCRPAR